ncbi:MAG: dephospho-CoA kinase [Oceanicoccus sp.]|jgi:dephospho-CoA kinase
MLTVGITGGIGSGKTAASDRFQQLGIDIIDADIASRVVVEPGRPALASIARHFGNDILTADGNLDRAALRQLIFAEPSQKQWLEALLHPLIAAEIKQQLQAATSPYVIFVSPLLIETEQHKLCHRILVIDIPESQQIARTSQRDNNDITQIKRIIASQASRQQRLDKADDVIENKQTIDILEQKVDKIHQYYLGLAAEHIRNDN